MEILEMGRFLMEQGMTFINYCLGGQIKEEMGKPCNRHGELRNAHRILVKNLTEEPN
jgi:hypothetical protein